MRSALLLLLVGIFSISIFHSCKKDDDDDNNGQSTTLQLHWHPTIGSQSFALNQEIADDNGRRFNFSRVQFYISGFTLSQTGNNAVYEDRYLLVEPNTTSYSIGDIAPGAYQGFHFNVGVDSTANHSDPSTYPNNHALANQNPSMHWSWNSGYKFLVLEGMIDTTAGATGSADVPFAIHVGTDDLLRTFQATSSFDVVEGVGHTIHLETDLSAFFDGLNLRESLTTHSASPLARSVANNTQQAFSLQH